jgi:hypothetical protein
MENGTGHGYRSHYRLIVDGDGVREALGEDRHVALAENAVCAELDGCVPCFEAVIDDIAAEPTALLTARRFGSLILGFAEGITPIGSDEEAQELQMIVTHLAQSRGLAAELLQFCAMNMLAAHHGHEAHPHHGRSGGGAKTKKRKVVRHPNPRVRTKGERRQDG